MQRTASAIVAHHTHARVKKECSCLPCVVVDSHVSCSRSSETQEGPAPCFSWPLRLILIVEVRGKGMKLICLRPRSYASNEASTI